MPNIVTDINANTASTIKRVFYFRVLQVQVKVRSSFLNLLSNETMIKKYEEYTTQLGTEVDTDETHQALGGGSTDMGNVSYEVPSIHPDFAIGSDCNTHTKEFTPAAGNTRC